MDVQSMRDRMKDILFTFREIATEAKFSQKKWSAYNMYIESYNSHNLQMIGLESIIFLGLAFAQVYFIKRLFETKIVV